MEIREVTDDDVIQLLHCAADDKENGMLFLNWGQYQRWLLDALYSPKVYQVLVADDGFGVIGFLVWKKYYANFKWWATLEYLYVGEDFRGQNVGIDLTMQFVHNAYNSSAQWLKFDTNVLPQKWLDSFLPNAPLSKYNLYQCNLRDEEVKGYYNDNLRRE